MLHTISELEKRRDKRIVLAEKRRKKDMELAVAVRKYDEDGIWSWWMVRSHSTLFIGILPYNIGHERRSSGGVDHRNISQASQGRAGAKSAPGSLPEYPQLIPPRICPSFTA